jgi:glutamate synthase (NADPH/NADH) large chain
VGDNFGAGMTGGMAFVHDAAGDFQARVNPDTILVHRLETAYWEGACRALVAEHAERTGSAFAAALLNDWEAQRGRFWQVVPKEIVERLAEPSRAPGEARRRA